MHEVLNEGRAWQARPSLSRKRALSHLAFAHHGAVDGFAGE